METESTAGQRGGVGCSVAVWGLRQTKTPQFERKRPVGDLVATRATTG